MNLYSKSCSSEFLILTVILEKTNTVVHITKPRTAHWVLFFNYLIYHSGVGIGEMIYSIRVLLFMQCLQGVFKALFLTKSKCPGILEVGFLANHLQPWALCYIKLTLQSAYSTCLTITFCFFCNISGMQSTWKKIFLKFTFVIKHSKHWKKL